jgi:hypothetical protein
MASNTNGHSERPWVAPEDGVCPGDYPVKAKLGSRVYRVPGAKGYEDSKPERCYSSVEAVEADGFNEAKR